MEGEWMFSERGKDLLVINNYKFTKSYELAVGTVRWRCSNRKCPAKVYTKHPDRTIENCYLIHNHEPENTIKRQAINNKLKQQSLEDLSKSPSDIIEKELKRTEGVKMNEVDLRNLKKNIYLHRLQHGKGASQKSSLVGSDDVTSETLSAVAKVELPSQPPPHLEHSTRNIDTNVISSAPTSMTPIGSRSESGQGHFLVSSTIMPLNSNNNSIPFPPLIVPSLTPLRSTTKPLARNDTDDLGSNRDQSGLAVDLPPLVMIGKELRDSNYVPANNLQVEVDHIRNKISSADKSLGLQTVVNTWDTMPLQQRVSSSMSEEVPPPVLHSQPLSPTKLKVTRQMAKPSQPLINPPIPANEEVCLRWNSHHANMQTSFPNLLHREQYVDVTLAAEGKTLKCHRLILSSCSTYFEEILDGISPLQHPVLFMKDIPFDILKSLCDFMYAGEVHIYQNSLEELLAVAESLKIKGLAGKSNESNESGSIADTTNEEKEKPIAKPMPEPPKLMKYPLKPPTLKPIAMEKHVRDDDVSDPLDLMEPLYEESAQESPMPCTSRDKFSIKRTISKKMKKRRHNDDDHERSSPPLFHARKGTKSRPNVRFPKYYAGEYETATNKPAIDPESLPPEFVDDPLMEVDEIKAEPIDVEDSFLEFKEDDSFLDDSTPRSRNYGGLLVANESVTEKDTFKRIRLTSPQTPIDITPVKIVKNVAPPPVEIRPVRPQDLENHNTIDIDDPLNVEVDGLTIEKVNSGIYQKMIGDSQLGSSFVITSVTSLIDPATECSESSSKEEDRLSEIVGDSNNKGTSSGCDSKNRVNVEMANCEIGKITVRKGIFVIAGDDHSENKEDAAASGSRTETNVCPDLDEDKILHLNDIYSETEISTSVVEGTGEPVSDQ